MYACVDDKKRKDIMIRDPIKGLAFRSYRSILQK
jgi:hypothetical protein